MPLTPDYSQGSITGGATTTFSCEFNHKTRSTLDSPGKASLTTNMHRCCPDIRILVLPGYQQEIFVTKYTMYISIDIYIVHLIMVSLG
jgi:hypothetical protein